MPKRVIWELALVGALFFHCAFAYLFRPQADQARPKGQPARAPCVFLPPPSEASADQKELLVWSELSDPTLLSLPNPARGFSEFLAEKEKPPLSIPPPPPPALASLARAEFPVLRLASPAENLAASMSRQWSVALPLGEDAGPFPALNRSVIWRFEDGTPLINPGDVPAADLRQALAAGKPQSPTRIQVTLQDRAGTRIVLRDGCGNAALDALALQRVAARAMEWERSLTFRQPSTETERFSFANDFSQMIEVEWRLLPEPAPAVAVPGTTPAAAGPASGGNGTVPGAAPAPKSAPGDEGKKLPNGS